ncbi:MAG: DUF4126 domain-containing protein [Anaerolineales bacterium]|nr:MAG: DUF4126 domain-containing protein [Anaerolineales bacterium]
MELVLSAIAAGGLVGASNQYLCLLLVSGAARLELIELAPQMGFFESWWFIGVVALFWVLTVAPAYASLLGPGVMNTVNAVTNFVSGFAVPLSGAILSLAAAGVIADMHPELRTVLHSLGLFDPEGGIGTSGFIVAGGGGLAASLLTGSRFLAKPALSSTTGTLATASAPIYTTVENLASVVLMALLYVLGRADPRLLVVVLVVLVVLSLGLLVYSIIQLRRLGKGLGRVIRLIEEKPKAGLSVVAEFFVWGSGWLVWQNRNRGIVRLVIWALWMLVVFVVVPAAVTAVAAPLVAIPPLVVLVSVLGTAAEVFFVAVGVFAGLRSARALLGQLEEGESQLEAAKEPAAA